MLNVPILNMQNTFIDTYVNEEKLDPPNTIYPIGFRITIKEKMFMYFNGTVDMFSVRKLGQQVRRTCLMWNGKKEETRYD